MCRSRTLGVVERSGEQRPPVVTGGLTLEHGGARVDRNPVASVGAGGPGPQKELRRFRGGKGREPPGTAGGGGLWFWAREGAGDHTTREIITRGCRLRAGGPPAPCRHRGRIE